MKTKDFVLRKLLLAATISTATGTLVLPAGCARNPKDKVAQNETENMSSTQDLLGVKTKLLALTDAQDFTRKSFERIDGEWLTLDKLSDAQKKLIEPIRKELEAKLKAAGTDQVRFSAAKDMIFLGIKGLEKKTFSYLWNIDGFFNLRNRKTVKGEDTRYLETAQEGVWYERGLIKISANAIAFPIKISDQDARLVFDRPVLEGANYKFGKEVVPAGILPKAWSDVYAYYSGRIPEGAGLQTRVVNNAYRIYWERPTSDKRVTLIEIARVNATLGFLDYSRDSLNKPTSSALGIVAGESADQSKYDAIQLKDETYVLVSEQNALAFKDDFFKAKTLGDVPNIEVQRRVLELLAAQGVTTESAISIVMTGDQLAITVLGVGGPDGTTLHFPATRAELYSGVDDISCLLCLTQESTSEITRRMPLFVVDSAGGISIPASKTETFYKAMEYAMKKSDVAAKTYVYYPVITDSSSADPTLGGGQTRLGDYSENAQPRKVVFSFDREYLTVKAAPGSVKIDPNNNDLPILKFPIKSHFNVRYSPTGKTYSRETVQNWKDAEYVEVDFSQQQLTNFFDDILALERMWGSYEGNVVEELLPEPMNRNKKDAYNPYLFVDNTPGQPHMVSWLTQYSLTPSLELTWDFNYPLTMKIRHGFRELNGDGTYKPRPYDFYDYHTFKVFTSKVYKPQDDLLEDKEQDFRQYANTYDVDPTRNKSVTYHLNRDFPVEYCSAAFAAADAWNSAFQKAYNNTSFTFVRLAEATAEQVAADPVYDRFKGKCKKPDGTYTLPELREVGDLRTNMLVLFPQNMDNGLAGFGPALHNPDTGEVISGHSFQYEHAFRSGKQRAATLWDYMKNEGNYNAFVRLRTKWMDPAELGVDVDTKVPATNVVPTAPVAAGNGLVAANDGNIFDAIVAEPKIEKAARRSIKPGSTGHRNMMRMIAEQLRDAADIGDAKLTQAYVKSFSEVLAANQAGASPSQFEGELNQIVKTRTDRNAKRAQSQTACDLAADGFNPTSGGDFYREMIAKRPNITKEEFVHEAAQRYFFSTTVHEMGHNFGFAHNFRGSVDKNNYPQRYQELAKRTDLTAAEKAEKTNLETSSVMEYMPGFVGDFYQGSEANKGSLGPYDIGAIAYTYAAQMEVKPEGNAGNSFDAIYTNRISREKFREALQGTILAGQGDLENKSDGIYNFVESTREALQARPYMFCTNGDNSLDELCATFDTGSTPSEIVNNAINAYETSFLVGSVNYGQHSYFVPGIGHALDRSGRSFASRIKQFFDTYDWLMTKYRGRGVSDDLAWEGTTLGDYKKAIVDGLSYLRKIVKAPAGTQMTTLDGGPLNVPLELSRDDYAITRNINGDTIPLRAGSMFEKISIISLLVAPTRSTKILYDEDGSVVSDIWTPVASQDKEIRGLAGEIMSDLLQGSATGEVNAVSVAGNPLLGPERNATNLPVDGAQAVPYNKNFLLEVPKIAQFFLGYFGNNHAFSDKLNQSLGFEKVCGNMSNSDFTISDDDLEFALPDVANSKCTYRFAKETDIGIGPVFRGVKNKILESAQASLTKRNIMGKDVFSQEDLTAVSPAGLAAASTNLAQLELDALALVKANLQKNIVEKYRIAASAEALKRVETAKTMAEFMAGFIETPENKGNAAANLLYEMFVRRAVDADVYVRPDIQQSLDTKRNYLASLDWGLELIFSTHMVLASLSTQPPQENAEAYLKSLAARRYASAIFTEALIEDFYTGDQFLYSFARDPATIKLGNYLNRLETVKTISNW